MSQEYNPIAQFRRGGRHATRQGAIKAMCAHCMGCTENHIEPGFMEEIRLCSSASCPLYKYRPYQRKES